MKKSIIQDIFYVKRGCGETIKESKEYWKVMGQAAKLSKELINGFTEKQKEIFDKLDFAEMGIEAETALTYFTEGFKIGVRIGIECMED